MRTESRKIVRIGGLGKRLFPARDAFSKRAVDILKRLFRCSAGGGICAVPEAIEHPARFNRLLGLISQKGVFERGRIILWVGAHGGFKLVTRLFVLSGLYDFGPLADLVRQAERLVEAPDPKLNATIKELKPLIAGGANPVVFCRFIATADHVAAGLRKAFPKLRIEAVTGALTPE